MTLLRAAAASATLLVLIAILRTGTIDAVQNPPAFRAETRLVVLYATVRSSRGAMVTGLDAEAFTVYEDGKRQSIDVFRSDDVPVSLGLLIDNSGSMRALRSRVEAAALALVRASNPDDEVFVVNFADTIRVDVPMTRDVGVLETGIARVDSIGGTAMRDAVVAGQDYLRQHATHDRRVLIVVTDGNDNASEATASAVQRVIERSETVVYAIGLFGRDGSPKAKSGRKALEELTERSGGAGYFPATIDEVGTVALELAHQIRNQYMIGYAPANQALDGTYRKIRVDASGRERFVVRTRPGYWAVPSR